MCKSMSDMSLLTSSVPQCWGPRCGCTPVPPVDTCWRVGWAPPWSLSWPQTWCWTESIFLRLHLQWCNDLELAVGLQNVVKLSIGMFAASPSTTWRQTIQQHRDTQCRELFHVFSLTPVFWQVPHTFIQLPTLSKKWFRCKEQTGIFLSVTATFSVSWGNFRLVFVFVPDLFPAI